MSVIVNAFGAPSLAAQHQETIGRIMAERERRAGHKPRLPRSETEVAQKKRKAAIRFRDPEIMAALVAAVAAEPGRQPPHYARMVGIGRSSAQQRLKLLAEHGRVRRDKRGEKHRSPVHYWPVDGGEA